MGEISWLAENRLVSQEEHCPVDLVMNLVLSCFVMGLITVESKIYP
jgi:hypothetical protein